MPQVFIGIEGVGMRHSTAVMADETGKVVSSHRIAEPISLHTNPRPILQDRLTRLITQVLRNGGYSLANLPSATVCIGLTGVTFKYHRQLTVPELFRTWGLECHNLIVTGDVEIAFVSHAKSLSGSAVLCHSGCTAYVIAKNGTLRTSKMTAEGLPVANIDLVESLHAESLSKTALAIAAQKASANVKWMQKERSRPLHLLDFDLICGSLRHVELARLASREAIPAHRKWETEALGPHTVRQLLGSLPEFCLPSGSMLELLSWVTKFRGQVKRRAEEVMKKFQSARDSRDPAAVLVKEAPTKTVVEAVLDEIEEFSSVAYDLKLMESLLTESRPVEEYLGTPPRDNYHNYQFAFHRLRRARGGAGDESNSCDAMNVTYLAWIYNARKTSDHPDCVPFLISQSLSIHRFTGYQLDLALPVHDELPMFHDRHYLLVANAVDREYEGHAPMVTSQTEALAVESQALANDYDHAAELVRQRGLRPDDLDQLAEWELLRIFAERFEDRWGFVLHPAYQATVLDRTAFRNALVSHELQELLDSLYKGDVEKRREAVRRLQRFLMVNWARDEQLRPLLFSPQQVSSDSHAKTTGDRGFYRAVLIDTSENDGRPLCQVTNGAPTDALRNFDFEAQHDIRVAVYSRLLWPNGAAMAVDSRFEPSKSKRRWLGVVWRYDCPEQRLWQTAIATLRGAGQGGSVTECSYTICTSKGLKAGNTTLDKAPSIMASLVKERRIAEYFEIMSGGVTFIGDVEPIEAAECQAGVFFASEVWSRPFADVLVQALAGTRQATIAKAYFREILQHLEAVLRVGVGSLR